MYGMLQPLEKLDWQVATGAVPCVQWPSQPTPAVLSNPPMSAYRSPADHMMLMWTGLWFL